MHQDTEAQVNRAKELLSDLEAHVKADLSKKEVSVETRNLTQEVLVKMRNIFDQVMHQFYDKEIAKNVDGAEKIKSISQ